MEAAAGTRVSRRGAFAGVRARLPASAWGLVDQALLSATNFVTMILVARALSPAAFGAFTLLYTTLLLGNGLHNTIVTQPHNVLGVSRSGTDYRRYSTSTGLSHLVVASALSGAALLAGVLAAAVGAAVAPLLVALAAASAAWLTQEFVRRVLYTERRFRAAVANDVVAYGGQALAIVALWRVDGLTAVRALLTIAATSALAVVVGGWQVRRSFAGGPRREDVRANWHFGKWLTGGFVAYWFSSQLYLYLAAVILGTSATATMKAALIAMGPLNVLLVFVDTTMPILFARTLDRGGLPAMRAQVRRTAVWLVPVVGLYCLAAGLFAEPLLQLFYGGRYANGGTVLVLFAVHYFLLSFTRTLAAAVGARRLTRCVFEAQATAGLVALTAGWLVIVLGGVDGAVLGTMASGVITGAILLKGYRAPERRAVG